jgi:nucleoside-diphosphate-sugar epimerase
MRRGEFRLRGDGSNWISRIHADDLAAHLESALFSDVTGAYPVADEHPCPSAEIAEFCARLLGLPLPASARDHELSETRRADRRVDGSAIRRLLGISLRYPSYLTGIPASLE